jgi:hypothetical protein
MIGSPRTSLQASGRLLTTGLPLRAPMPLHQEDPAGTSPTQEGPLALDYREWGIKVELPPMLADVSYTLCKQELAYDGVCYTAELNDRVDDL